MNISDPAYWWVNHKQTFKAEIDGGYIWSPKTNADGRANQTYINLTKVVPGDLVFSYANTLIAAIGVVLATAQEEPKPEEFGSSVGANWSDDEGWLVPIEWTILPTPVKPKQHIDRIAPLLPDKHSPIQPNGNGNQGCYLASISSDLGQLLLSVTGHVSQLRQLQEQLQEEEIQDQIQSSGLQPTEKEQLIRARLGQGSFRLHVLRFERRCRVTGLDDDRLLVASHIKPWRDASDQERLDGENGLMLSPHVDRLFDQGWISFTDHGEMLLTDMAERALHAWHVDPTMNVGHFSEGQSRYLAYHRTYVFQGAGKSSLPSA